MRGKLKPVGRLMARGWVLIFMRVMVQVWASSLAALSADALFLCKRFIALTGGCAETNRSQAKVDAGGRVKGARYWRPSRASASGLSRNCSESPLMVSARPSVSGVAPISIFAAARC